MLELPAGARIRKKVPKLIFKKIIGGGWGICAPRANHEVSPFLFL